MIFTDHKPLTFAFSKHSDAWYAHQQRHFSAISEFTMCVQHLSGKNSSVADALSRISVNSPLPGIDYLALTAAQRHDAEITAYRTAITNLDLQDVSFGITNATLLCDVSTGHPRPVVPNAWRRQIFETIHGLSHIGIQATQKLISAKFVWHGLRQQVAHCVLCQTAKIQLHTEASSSSSSSSSLNF